MEGLPRRHKVADSSARTILRILEQKGYVRHTKEGRAFMYQAAVARGDVRRTMLEYVMERFFNSSPELLVLNLLENETLDGDELERLRKMTESPRAPNRP